MKANERKIIDPIKGCWFLKNNKLNNYSAAPIVNGYRENIHVWAYKYFVGEIPDNYDVDHRCSIKACWNPDHLQVLSKSDHSKTTWARGERKSTRNQHTNKIHCKHGHEFTLDNTKIRSDGVRICRECLRRRKRESYARLHS